MHSNILRKRKSTEQSIDERIKEAYYEGWEDCEQAFFEAIDPDQLDKRFLNYLPNYKQNLYYEFSKRKALEFIS